MALLAGLQANTSGMRTFTAGSGALSAFRAVVFASGVINHAANTATRILGFTTESGALAGAPVNVRLANSPGTFLVTAGGVISAGADVILTDAGKVLTTATGTKTILGQAITASTADGDIIEIAINFAHDATGS